MSTLSSWNLGLRRVATQTGSNHPPDQMLCAVHFHDDVEVEICGGRPVLAPAPSSRDSVTASKSCCLPTSPILESSSLNCWDPPNRWRFWNSNCARCVESLCFRRWLSKQRQGCRQRCRQRNFETEPRLPGLGLETTLGGKDASQPSHDQITITDRPM